MSGKRGFTSRGRHGAAKKQKLTSLSKELITSTKTARSLAQRDADRARKLAEKKAGKRETRARIPYNRFHQILTIGEGNFSFTRALVEHFQQQEKDGFMPSVPTKARREEEEEDEEERAANKKSGKKGGKDEEDKKTRFRKEGAFDPAIHTPFLPPGSVFTNPNCRVVATCYDSFREVTFKYPDVSSYLSYLRASSIPIYTGVDALHFEHARRRPVTEAMVEQARVEESRDADERQRARKRRRELEDSQEDYQHAQDEEEAHDTAKSPLLFPPFVTRRALHGLQADAENKLHGSQRKKWRAQRAKDQEEFKAAVSDMTEGAKPSEGDAANKSKSRPPTAAVLRMKERAQMTDAQLAQINMAPRTRFHRIIFNFPHTGCGIKDTERNNEHHRVFLDSFFRNVVGNRLVYPVDQFGEIHVTIKKGEPYRSWNIIQVAKRIPGLKFKTSVEFYPQLYRGYEHRRTRGFEDRAVDLSTGAVIAANADINGGAMTYVFTRERTAMDDEEARFDAEWIARHGVQSEADEVRRQLLAECDRIYRETRAKHGDTTAQMDMEAANTTDVPSDEEGEEDVDGEAEDDDMDESAEQDEEDPADDEEQADSANEDEPDAEEAAPEAAELDQNDAEDAQPAHASAANDGASDDDDDAPPVLAADFAAAFRQHFQARPAAPAAAPAQAARKPTKQQTPRGGAKKARR